MIREIAHLAMQDGASHPDLTKLACAGNWGAQSGNIHKQIMNKSCPNVMRAAPFHIKVPCIDPKTSLEKEDWAAVFLPHLQFAPGMCLEKHWKQKVVPLMVHGDGVEYHNRDSLMVWSWGCMLTEMPSLKQHMLLAAFPKVAPHPKLGRLSGSG